MTHHDKFHLPKKKKKQKSTHILKFILTLTVKLLLCLISPFVKWKTYQIQPIIKDYNVTSFQPSFCLGRSGPLE